MANEIKTQFDIARMVMDAEDSKLNSEHYGMFVGGCFSLSGKASIDFTHASLGIITESSEVADEWEEEPLLDEGGDILFYYIAALATIVGASNKTPEDFLKFADTYNSGVEENVRKALKEEGYWGHERREIARLLDINKKWIGYGKIPTIEQCVEALDLCTSLTFSAFELAAARLNRTDYVQLANEMVERNIAKLSKRYPGAKFNAECAKNPDKVAEREAMRKVSVGSVQQPQ